ncbi:MAG: phosphate signaling complex protein PhoU [Sedimenticolaceae bacterium]|nr:phosphate signaling complex protein PhoU [Sedimenticolaceae bacterium]
MALTHQSLSKDEKTIQGLISSMGLAVSQGFRRASDAFMEHDEELASEVIGADQQINALCSQIEEQCFVTIALRQPVANDLRSLLANMHIAQEYERIADYAADIARKVHEMKAIPKKECRDQFQLLIDLCTLMLDQVNTLLESPDEQDARVLAAEDDKVDEEEKVLVNSLISQMRSDPDSIETCVHAISVAHKMERIADRVTNIAERIVFSTSGEMVELG